MTLQTYRTVLITGASRGLGLALARRLAQDGWNLIIDARGAAGLEMARSELAQYGFPIRYSYVREGWLIAYYQTVYAAAMGSAETPSAGRAFTPQLLTRLMARGVHVAPTAAAHGCGQSGGARAAL